MESTSDSESDFEELSRLREAIGDVSQGNMRNQGTEFSFQQLFYVILSSAVSMKQVLCGQANDEDRYIGMVILSFFHFC